MQLFVILTLGAIGLPAVFGAPIKAPVKDVDQKRGVLYNYIAVDAAELEKMGAALWSTSGAPVAAGAALEGRGYLLPFVARNGRTEVGEIVDSSVLLVGVVAVAVGVAIENVSISDLRSAAPKQILRTEVWGLRTALRVSYIDVETFPVEVGFGAVLDMRGERTAHERERG
ncbi:hypothetical protein PG996_011425 [Apiospora saccharicola]|uniref:Uncharacterized protein n=1 Tax=Apiospora saccharicola TaxID=335842 RepID=A0ABR1UF17_9PEZI